MKSKRSLLSALFTCLLFLVAGCAGNKATPAEQRPRDSRKPAAKADNSTVDPARPRSSFVVDASYCDPFFPEQKRKAESAAGQPRKDPAKPDIREDVPQLLTAALQGIGGTTQRRLAVLNNIIVEPGRTAEIPVRAGGQEQRLKVHCWNITRDTVQLEVEGYGPVTITRKKLL